MNGHLSRRIVANTLKRTLKLGGEPTLLVILHQVGFTGRTSRHAAGAFTAPFPPYRKIGGIFLLHSP